ncbi:MAG TPA: 30S ribosomal protein S12 methylthiotransferase RimO [Syntrophomonas sp.]|nr:30S ribosomal protein S12 methylthiotransferase RimO [Syntrophomonas sp.]
MTTIKHSDYRVGFISLGCAKNQVDSEIMIARLKNSGYKIVSDIEKAEIIVINTCGFIEAAREEAINTIIETGQLKEYGGLQYLICTGCLAQRYGQELLDELPELDGLIGISDFTAIDQYLEQIIGGERLIAVSPPPLTFIEKGKRILTTPPGYAYLKITEGCDNRCSYCAIPSIRGGLRSCPPEDLLSEARELVGKGVKELVVIGQDTAVYGQDQPDNIGLDHLLRQLVQVDGLHWIRLLYLHPAHITSNIIDTIASEKKIVPYLDIPIQHASDKILKVMNRKHSSADLRNILAELRRRIDGLALRTTIMLGFPGESEEDFKILYDFMGETEFDWVGAFAFTPEEGTTAIKMPDQVPEEIKQERLAAIMKLQKSISRKKNKERLQQKYDILISSSPASNLYLGRTYFQAPEVDGVTMVKSEKKLTKGDFAKVELKAIRDYDMIGEVADECSQ